MNVAEPELPGFEPPPPDERPVHGPERPDEVDAARWVLATAELTEAQRNAIEDLVLAYEQELEREL